MHPVYFYSAVVVIAIFVITFVSHIPFYFLMRKRMREMQTLAQEFRLSFTSAFPHFWAVLFLYFFRDLKINRIEGTIAGRHVSVYDVYHFNLIQIYKYYERETVMEVDGKTLKEGYKNFSLARTSLTSIEELHKIFKGLKQSESPFEEE